MMKNIRSSWLQITLLIQIFLAFRTIESGVPRVGPMIIKITAVSSTSLNVTWQKLNTNESNVEIFGYLCCYRVHKVNAGGICSNMEAISGVNNTTIILTNLMKATSYDVAIRAGSTGGYGAVGNIVTHKTLDEDVKSGPEIKNITAFMITSTSINVKWEIVPNGNNITHYIVCFEPAPISPEEICSDKETVVGAKERNILLLDLSPFTTYEIVIKAATLIETGHRAGITVTTLEGVPSKGPNITVTAVVSATSIKIRWESLNIANSNGIITKYEVCYIASQNHGEINCNFRRIVEGNTTEVVLDELMEATVYNVAVKAATKAGLGPLGTIVTGKTLEDVPSKGPNITVLTVVSATSIKIRWESVTNANSNGVITKYEVCYIASQNPSEINCNFRRIVEGNTTEVVLDELMEATVYNVAVKASTKAGLGPLGTIMTGKTLEDEPSTGPTISITAVTSDALKVTWQKLHADDANGVVIKYEVCYQHGFSVSDCSISKMINNGDDTVTDINGLKPATLYAVAVRAFTAVGPGPLGRESRNITKAAVTPTVNAQMQSEKESYRYGLIALAVIVVILLIIIAYFVYQNRTLTKSIDEIKQIAKCRNIMKDDVSHARQIDTNDEGNDDMNYDDVRNDEETYTALDKTGKEDEDHVYCHLNNKMQENVNEAQV